jgi:hypothetical protein
MEIKFNHSSDTEVHECESHRKGDWIIFRCPLCPDYERRMNWRTGEMNVKNNTADINHTGSYFPYEYLGAFVNVN